MTTLSDRIPEFSLGNGRRPRREPVGPDGPGAGEPLDAETREVVDTFEALYADLSSSSDANASSSPEEAALDDELHFDLPQDFERELNAPSASERATRRDPRRHEQRAPLAGAASEHAEPEGPLGIEDAFAVLHAAEARGRANAARDALDLEDEEAAPVRTTLPAPAPRRERTRASIRHESAPPAWTVRTRALWPKIAGAALVALIAGTAVGYLAGRGPAAPARQATIPVTPEGAARLQFDYELHSR